MSTILNVSSSLLIGALIFICPNHAPSSHVSTSGCSPDSCKSTQLLRVATGSSPWRFGRTTSPDQKDSFASVTKTAETLQSDPDFAGLMVRCSAGGKIDVLVVLVRPFPPKSRPQVTIRGNDASSVAFEGTMATGAAAVILPQSASILPGGQWQRLASLLIAVKDGPDEIKGTVDLGGLGASYANLVRGCG